MSREYCLDCGAKLVPGAKFCSECGTSVREADAGGGFDSTKARPVGTHTTSSEAATHTTSSETVFCRACGAEILAAAEICPTCGVPQRGAHSHEEKNPALAAILSLFVAGAGQLYNGDVAKGIVLMVAELTLLMLFALTLWFFVGLVFVPVLLVVWGYAIWDAWDKAEKINRGEYRP